MQRIIGDKEWQNRLIKAVLNVVPLLDMPLEEFTDYLIELLEGKADQLRGKEDMPRKVQPIAMSDDRNQRLARWYELQKQLKDIQNEEHQLRQALVMDMFDVDKLEGVQSVDVGSGWRLKATKELNVTATNESGQTMALLDAVGAIDPGLAVGLVKWKPDVSKTIYRDVLALTDKHPDLKIKFAAAITVKPGMPALELVPPKAETSTPVVETDVPQVKGEVVIDAPNSEITW